MIFVVVLAMISALIMTHFADTKPVLAPTPTQTTTAEALTIFRPSTGWRMPFRETS